MKATTKTNIEIEGNELEDLRSGLKKVVDEITKPGLKNNSITDTEAKLIKDLFESL